MREGGYRRRRGGWFSGLLWMLSGGAVAATVLVGFNNFQWSDRLFHAFNTLVNPPQPQPKVDVRSLVLQQVREASELTTAAFTMQAVVPTEQDATLSGFVIGKTKLLYIAQGEVKAGVDLSQITSDSVQVSGDTVQLQLPVAQILDQKIDVARSQVYDYDRGFLGLGPDTAPDLQSLAQQEALKKIVAAACEQGLLQKASDRAKFVVTQLLTTAGYKTVTVDATPVSTEACLSQVNEQREPIPTNIETRNEAKPEPPNSNLNP